MKPQPFRRSGIQAALALGVAATVLAACGSSSTSKSSNATSPTSSGGSSGTSAAAPKGSPLVIYNSTEINQPSGSYPGISSGALAAARAINAKGGIDGHPVDVKTCDIVDANDEAICVHHAISDHAIAFVGALMPYNAAADEAEMKAAGIPSISPQDLEPSAYQNPDNYMLIGLPLETFGCLKDLPAVSGKSVQAYVSYEIPSLEQAEGQIKQIAGQLGANLKTIINIAPTQTVYTSTVQQLTNAKVQIINTALGAPNFTGLLSAAASVGASFVSCTDAAALDSADLTSLGSAANGVYVISDFPPLSESAKYPLLGQYLTQMAAEEKSGDSGANLNNVPSQDGLNSWLGMQVVFQAASKISGAITGQSLTSTLNSSTITLGNLIPPMNFSKPAPDTAYPRLYNPDQFLLKWDTASKSFIATNSPVGDAYTLLPGS